MFKKSYKDGTTRVVHKFLFFPKRLGLYKAWLVFVAIEQDYCLFWNRWLDIKFLPEYTESKKKLKEYIKDVLKDFWK